MPMRGIIKRAKVGFFTVAIIVATTAIQAQTGAVVLKPADMQKLLPASLFYRGQTATTQLRNSGGVKFPDGSLVLATMVDTSGYSTAVAAIYQAQLITEVPINVGGKRLGAGVYGIGFLADNKFVVTDIGAHQVLSVNSATDAGLKRPRPLEVLPDPSGGFRLYAGRRYVVLAQ
jgi:hypothetical protein